MAKLQFNYTDAIQTYSVPTGVTIGTIGPGVTTITFTVVVTTIPSPNTIINT